MRETTLLKRLEALETKKLIEPEQLDSIKEMIKEIKKRDLKQLDGFLNAHEKLAEDLERLATNADAIVENIKQQAKREGGKKSSLKTAAKTAAALCAGAATLYLGGPYAAIVARYLFTQFYASSVGIPSLWNPSYYLVFLPMREHAGMLAYNYGPAALAPLASTATWATMGVVNSTVGAISSVGSLAYQSLPAFKTTVNEVEAGDLNLISAQESNEDIEDMPKLIESAQESNEDMPELIKKEAKMLIFNINGLTIPKEESRLNEEAGVNAEVSMVPQVSGPRP